MNLMNIERSALALFALSALTVGCMAESSDHDPRSSTGPVGAEVPSPPPARNAKSGTSADVVGPKTDESASASAADAAENAVPAPNPPFVGSTKTSPCSLACALCALPGHADECARCHSEECR